MNAEEIKRVLDLHGKWARGEEEGVRAYLRGAYLRGADLSGADLSVANLRDAYLTGSELFEVYCSDVVPALLTAGGKTLQEVLDTGCWECHDWSNCPMHAAFGISNPDEAPVLLRPRVKEFVQLFDAGLLPKPEVK